MKLRKHSRVYYSRSILMKVWNHPANRHNRLLSVVKALGWQLYKRVVGKPLVVPYHHSGISFVCRPLYGSASNVIYFGGRPDYDLMMFWERYLRQDDCVVDIGANIGMYTLLGAGIVGKNGSVIAIEPAPEAIQGLRENVAVNRLSLDFAP